MGVINSFILSLRNPKRPEEIEKALIINGQKLGIKLKLFLPSPEIGYSNTYSNVLDFYFPETKEPINGELDYQVNNLNSETSRIVYSGYYSDFILDIKTFGYDRFEQLLSFLFEAKEIKIIAE